MNDSAQTAASAYLEKLDQVVAAVIAPAAPATRPLTTGEVAAGKLTATSQAAAVLRTDYPANGDQRC